MAMSKKKLLAVALVSVLLVSVLAGMQFFNVAKGNWYAAYPPEIRIQSQNVTYTTNDVSFDFEVVYYSWGESLYSIDGAKKEYVSRISSGPPPAMPGAPFSYYYKLNFTLPEGPHTLVIYAYQSDAGSGAESASATVYFTINSTATFPTPSPSEKPSPSPSPSPAYFQQLNLR